MHTPLRVIRTMSRIEGSAKNFRLERTLSVVVLFALLTTFVYALLEWQPAAAQPAAVEIEVNAPAKVGLISPGPTTFTPNPAEAPVGAQVKFKLKSGSADANVTVVDPPDGFTPTSCPLSAATPECTVVLKPGYEGEITYEDASNNNPVNPGSGKIVTEGSSASPSSSPSASASPSASPSGSPSASPSPTSSASPSPSPSGSPSPGPVVHERTLTLKLKAKKRALRAMGFMFSDDPGCVDGAPIKIQRKRGKRWKTVRPDQLGMTTYVDNQGSGRYRTSIPKKQGRYRALSIKYSDDPENPKNTCARVTSNKVRFHK